MTEQSTSNVRSLDEWRRSRPERAASDGGSRRPGTGRNGRPLGRRHPLAPPSGTWSPHRNGPAGYGNRYGGRGANPPRLYSVDARTRPLRRSSPGRILATVLLFAGALVVAVGLLWWWTLPPAMLPAPRSPIQHGSLQDELAVPKHDATAATVPAGRGSLTEL